MKKLIIVLSVVFCLQLAVSALYAAGAGDIQAKRMNFIKKCIKEGYFRKVEVPGSLPHVWVTPRFYRLDFDTKQQFINVVYAYYVTDDKRRNIVVLYDSKTGKKVGSYSELQGGLSLK
jgi:hypothetical protein